MAAIDGKPGGPKETTSLVANEQKKRTATYLNVLAGSFFTAGVAAPIAAAVFGVAGSSSPIAALTLVLGTMIFMAGSVGLHVSARAVLKGLTP